MRVRPREERARFEALLRRRADRRRVLTGAAGLVTVSVAGLPTRARGQATPVGSPAASPTFTTDPFTLGVASGDPLPEGVVLWTRLASDPLGGGGLDDEGAIDVRWEVANDDRFGEVVQAGTVVADPALAHSVHVDVTGLASGREYFYRFMAGDEVSPVGRTKTAPALGAPLDRLSFATASCQHWVRGYFTPYRHMAAEELDLVIHLGDYIYEGGPAMYATAEDAVRLHTGGTCRTLADYRNRHALYKTDPDLQAAHASFPWVAILDNHDAVEDGDRDGGSLERRAAAYQAWYEHLPVRPGSMPDGPSMQVYRRLAFGDLAEFSLLDTRQFKDDQHVCGAAPPNPTGLPIGGPLCPPMLEDERTMLGTGQERWLLEGLAGSAARWNVIAQTIFFAPFDYVAGPEEVVYWAAWDGYPAARARILRHLRERRPSNPVMLSGDWHSSWVNHLKADLRDPESETLATEFVTSSISSNYPGEVEAAEKALPWNPHVRFFNGDLRGYTRFTLDRERLRADFRLVDGVRTPDGLIDTRASFVVEDGRPAAVRA
jgi:alkaline phosphatase D